MKDIIVEQHLIDFAIMLDEDPELVGNGPEQFRALLKDFLFQEECAHKSMVMFFNRFEIPDFMNKTHSLLDIKITELRPYIEGATIYDSLAGKVFLSREYLHIYYSNHEPMFKKIPSDIQQEIINHIKKKNTEMLHLFMQLVTDMEHEKKRTVLQLIALILTTIHKYHNVALVPLHEKAAAIINESYHNADEIFRAKPSQLAELLDTGTIRNLIKKFFIIKNFHEVEDLTRSFQQEVERYKKRAIRL